MVTTTIREFRKNSKEYMDLVTNDDETVIIPRHGGKQAVVMISLEQYDKYETFRRLAKYYEMLTANKINNKGDDEDEIK